MRPANIFKNPELRLPIVLSLCGTAFFTVIGFILSVYAGILVLSASIFFTALYYFATARRYQSIANLCESIDRVLHGCDELFIATSREGELSLLESEISKMTVRLREQADGLRRDKHRMSDAIADISHQLRTPLTSMNLTISRLIGSEAAPEDRAKLLYSLRSQLSRIETLIEALLKMSKLDAGTAMMKKEDLSVRELIDKALSPFAVPMELRGQSLEVAVGDERFVGDMTWTLEAICNIIKNCTEHTPEGGVIKITASECPLFCEIRISDNGYGIDPADLPHIFERFYRGKSAPATSIGIGLALARAVITEQGGTLTAANLPHGGALFTVRFYKGVV